MGKSGEEFTSAHKHARHLNFLVFLLHFMNQKLPNAFEQLDVTLLFKSGHRSITNFDQPLDVVCLFYLSYIGPNFSNLIAQLGRRLGGTRKLNFESIEIFLASIGERLLARSRQPLTIQLDLGLQANAFRAQFSKRWMLFSQRREPLNIVTLKRDVGEGFFYLSVNLFYFFFDICNFA